MLERGVECALHLLRLAHIVMNKREFHFVNTNSSLEALYTASATAAAKGMASRCSCMALISAFEAASVSEQHTV